MGLSRRHRAPAQPSFGWLSREGAAAHSGGRDLLPLAGVGLMGDGRDWRWQDEFVKLMPAVVWSGEARRELPVRANSRRLILDYFAARCCGGNVSVGDLHLRWIAADVATTDEFLPIRAPAGLEAYIQRDLAAVLKAARARIVMRGWRYFRRPAVELEDGALWLDFVSACRTRSPIRH